MSKQKLAEYICTQHFLKDRSPGDQLPTEFIKKCCSMAGKVPSVAESIGVTKQAIYDWIHERSKCTGTSAEAFLFYVLEYAGFVTRTPIPFLVQGHGNYGDDTLRKGLQISNRACTASGKSPLTILSENIPESWDVAGIEVMPMVADYHAYNVYYTLK